MPSARVLPIVRRTPSGTVSREHVRSVISGRSERLTLLASQFLGEADRTSRASAVRGRHAIAAVALAAFVGLVGLAAAADHRGTIKGRVTILRGLVYRVAGGQTLRLDAYLPRSNGSPRPAVVIVHGGGWRSGTRATFAPGESSVEPTARLFAARGWATFSIDYRLAPASRFPAEVSDVQSALAWVRRNGVRYHIDPRRIALLGASAGGNLAVQAALTSMSGAAPAAAVSWSGPMDLTNFYRALATRESRPFVVDYLGCVPAACPSRYRDASPADQVTATSPPTLLANGTKEIVPLQQASEMTAALAAKNVPHAVVIIPGSRHAADYEPAVINRTISFLAARFAIRVPVGRSVARASGWPRRRNRWRP